MSFNKDYHNTYALERAHKAAREALTVNSFINEFGEKITMLEDALNELWKFAAFFCEQSPRMYDNVSVSIQTDFAGEKAWAYINEYFSNYSDESIGQVTSAMTQMLGIAPRMIVTDNGTRFIYIWENMFNEDGPLRTEVERKNERCILKNFRDLPFSITISFGRSGCEFIEVVKTTTQLVCKDSPEGQEYIKNQAAIKENTSGSYTDEELEAMTAPEHKE